jgi:hypothetical protein
VSVPREARRPTVSRGRGRQRARELVFGLGKTHVRRLRALIDDSQYARRARVYFFAREGTRYAFCQTQEMNTEAAIAGAAKHILMVTRGIFLGPQRGCRPSPLADEARPGTIGAALGERAASVPGIVEVHPTGVFPQDVEEVASAINGGAGPSGIVYEGGGTVLLKATTAAGVPTAFNFGMGAWPLDRGSVEVRKDVHILGEDCNGVPQNLAPDAERDSAYKPNRTVIYGGKRPFRCACTNAAATRLSVRNLYFAYPTLAAIQVSKSAGLLVQDCVIYDVRSDVTDAPLVVPMAAVGIEAAGGRQEFSELTGEFRVEDNRIWRRPPTPGFYAVDAGIVVQLASMVAVIRRNDITGFAYAGIRIDRNAQRCSIQDNRVTRCGYGPLATSAGIATKGTASSISIARNEVECGEHGPSQLSKSGINLVRSNNVWIASNSVSGTGASVGIGLINGSSDCVLHGNRLQNLVAGTMQVHVSGGSQGNLLVRNEYGGVMATGIAGAFVEGENNQLISERFVGSYLGPRQPCIWLATTSSANRVSQLKYGVLPDWAPCMQVRDEGVSNFVTHLEHCQPG